MTQSYEWQTNELSYSWDASTLRPIVTDQILNPTTGSVCPAGEIRTYGPPNIDMNWWNRSQSPTLKGTHGPTVRSLDNLLCNVATLFATGDMHFVALTASAYYVSIICDSQLLTTDEAWEATWGRLLIQDAQPPPSSASGAVNRPSKSHKATPEGVLSSHSKISTIWRLQGSLSTIEKTLTYSVDELYAEITRHIFALLYSVESLSLGESAVFVVCKLKFDLEEFEALLGKLPH